MGLLATVVLSSTGVLIRHLMVAHGMPPMVLAAWRAALVVLTLSVALAIGRPALLRIDRRHIGYLARYGLLLAVYNACFTFSVSVNGAAVATVLVCCAGAFAAVLGRWLLKESLGWAKALAVVASIGGSVLVSQVWVPGRSGAGQTLPLVGLLLGLASACLYAGYSLMGRVAWQRGLNPWTTLLYTFGFATAWLLVPNLAPALGMPGAARNLGELWWFGSSLAGWGLILALSAGPTLCGYGLYNVTLTLLPSSVANLIVTVEPGFTALIAYALLGERLTLPQMAGAAAALAGVALLRINEGRQAGGQAGDAVARRDAGGAAVVVAAGSTVVATDSPAAAAGSRAAAAGSSTAEG
jgi:drug/metabolite transporter (DMT)-like permease